MWGFIFLLLAASPNRHSTPKTDFIRLQVLLDRNHFSPGEIDGQFGRATRFALVAFQAANDVPRTGRPDAATLRKLETNQENVPTLISYTVTDEDEGGPFVTVPDDLMEQAKLTELGYQSPVEELGAMFH